MRFCFTIVLLSLFISANAQDDKKSIQSYNEAEAEYNIGHFEEADSILRANLSSYKSNIKASAYRLLALCAIVTGDDEAARKNTSLMFRENPYYTTTVNDPIRFVDLVNSMKRGEAMVSTASQQSESLSEVPVPVTLITEDMIKASGARNLQDLLLLYVPGMTPIAGDELNVAMHGIYSDSQEKILIMQDGHRLNSRSTNAEVPDYRMSLKKIKQIEVLRGPASSLYGNVALTAVVNIITKKGHDMDGVEISGGLGTNNTYRADFTMGKSAVDMSFSSWASIYASRGERRDCSGAGDELFYGTSDYPSYMYIGGYNNMPSFDIGFNGTYKDFTMMFDVQSSKSVPSYAQTLYPTLYDYNKFRKIDGVTPGRTRTSMHLDLSYSKSFGNLGLKVNAFMDYDKQTYYDVLIDSINPANINRIFEGKSSYSQGTINLLETLIGELVQDRKLGDIIGTDKTLIDFLGQLSGYDNIKDILGTDISEYLTNVGTGMTLGSFLGILINNSQYKDKTVGDILGLMENGKLSKDFEKKLLNILYDRGLYQLQSWSEYTYGASAQLNYAFESKLFTGNLLGGFQFEQYTLHDSKILCGDGYSHVLVTFSSDNPVLIPGKEYVLSPFVQLKSTIGDKLIFNGGIRYDHKKRNSGAKLNAFSPRVSLIWLLNNYMNLKLGYAHSFVDAPYFYRNNGMKIYNGGGNLTSEKMDAIQLEYTISNPAKGLSFGANIFYNALSNLIWHDSQSNDALYANAGKVRIIGIDNSLNYTGSRLFASLSMSYMRVLYSENANVTSVYMNNVPAFMAATVARYKIFDSKMGRLFARANGTFYTKQYSPITSEVVYRMDLPAKDLYNTLPARFIMNCGADYTYKFCTLSLDVYNLFNTNYYQGGSLTLIPLPQQGRSFMANLSFKF